MHFSSTEVGTSGGKIRRVSDAPRSRPIAPSDSRPRAASRRERSGVSRMSNRQGLTPSEGRPRGAGPGAGCRWPASRRGRRASERARAGSSAGLSGESAGFGASAGLSVAGVSGDGGAGIGAGAGVGAVAGAGMVVGAESTGTAGVVVPGLGPRGPVIVGAVFGVGVSIIPPGMPGFTAEAPAVGISRSIPPTRMIIRIVPRRSASTIGSTPGSRRVETRVSTPETASS